MRCRAILRSVFTRAPLLRGIIEGAMTSHSITSEVTSRCVSYPIGPAS